MGSVEISQNFLKNLISDFAVGKNASLSLLEANYSIKYEDIFNEVVIFVLYHLGQRNCPRHLAIYIARRIATEISSSIEKTESNEVPTVEALHMVSLDHLQRLGHELLENPECLESFACDQDLPLISEHAIKNVRRKMEDRHVIIHDLNTLFQLQNYPKMHYYAVFDGHGGVNAANFASVNLHVNMIQHPDFPSDPAKAIFDAYKLTDEQFCTRSNSFYKCGCTAISALIRDNTLYLAWLGDSQAVMVKNGQPVILMDPHKPDRQDERERIESLKGCVLDLHGVARVNGALAVSRAIGDPDFKPYISSEPEINIVPLDGTEDFLVVACDGLWDGMTFMEATVALYQMVQSNPEEALDIVAKNLVFKAADGSEDNISVIVVFLRNPSDIARDAQKYISSFNLSECQNSNAKNTELLSHVDSIFDSSDFQQRDFVPDSTCIEVPMPEFVTSSSVSPGYDGFEEAMLSELPTPPIGDLASNVQSVALPEQVAELQSALQNNCVASSENLPVETSNLEEEKIANFVNNIIESAVTHAEKIKTPETEVACNGGFEKAGVSAELEVVRREQPLLDFGLDVPSSDGSTVDINAHQMEALSLQEHTEETSVDALVSIGLVETEIPTISQFTDGEKKAGDNADIVEDLLQFSENAGSELGKVLLPSKGLMDHVEVQSVGVTENSNVDSEMIQVAQEVKPTLVDQLPADISTLKECAISEVPLTSVAIDLNAVPEFVPEAEGVIEDNDTDSEKDGGWSYVKATEAKATPTKSTAAEAGKKKVIKASKPLLNAAGVAKKPLAVSKSATLAAKIPATRAKLPLKPTVSEQKPTAMKTISKAAPKLASASTSSVGAKPAELKTKKVTSVSKEAVTAKPLRTTVRPPVGTDKSVPTRPTTSAVTASRPISSVAKPQTPRPRSAIQPAKEKTPVTSTRLTSVAPAKKPLPTVKVSTATPLSHVTKSNTQVPGKTQKTTAAVTNSKDVKNTLNRMIHTEKVASKTRFQPKNPLLSKDHASPLKSPRSNLSPRVSKSPAASNLTAVNNRANKMKDAKAVGLGIKKTTTKSGMSPNKPESKKTVEATTSTATNIKSEVETQNSLPNSLSETTGAEEMKESNPEIIQEPTPVIIPDSATNEM